MNLPNKLTILRVLLIPIFIIIYMFQDRIDYGNIITCVIFCAASFTDFLDGYIARKRNLVTDFGKLMDPLADKLLVGTALILFVYSGWLNPIIVIVIIGRDFIISGVRLVAASKGRVIAASYWGKLKTMSQMLMIILVLLNFEILPLVYFKNAIIWIAFALTIISLIDYLWKNREFFKV